MDKEAELKKIADTLDKLHEIECILKDRGRKTKRSVALLNAVTVPWRLLKTIIADVDNWKDYEEELDDREEGWSLCSQGNGGCCSGSCSVYPDLYQFETLNNDFGGRLIKCMVCFENHAFDLDDYIDEHD